MGHSILCRFKQALLPILIGFLCLTSSLAAPLQLLSTKDASLSSSASAGGDSTSPILSADGRYVLFSSTAQNLVSVGTNPISAPFPPSKNVYLRDRLNGTTTLISWNLSGTGGGDGNSLPVEISSNGRFALFESSAGNLVANDTNNAPDIFVRDLQTAITTLVSVSTNNRSGNLASRSPAMTPDGRFVAFVSEAYNLVPGDTNRIADIFVRDLQTGETALASPRAMATSPAPAFTSFSESPQITPDGHYIAFYSTATNLVPGVRTTGEIYVRDLVAGTTTLVSTNARSIMQTIANTNNAISYNHVISDDGQIVAFEASPVAGPNLGLGIILRHNLATGITEIINTNACRVTVSQEAVSSTLEMTPDGRFIAYLANNTLFPGATNSSVYVWDAQLGTNILASGDLTGSVSSNIFCSWPSITPSGRFVAFVADNVATNLVINGDITTNSYRNRSHIYLRDLQSFTTQLIDIGPDDMGAGVEPLTLSRLSDDGRFVAFETFESDLVVADYNRAFDVFVRDTATETTELISARHTSLPSASPNAATSASGFMISTNGRYMVLTSSADDLVLNDPNGYADIFVRDLLNGSNMLVSISTNGISGNGMSTDASISGDGRYIAFSSSANNLTAGDTGNFNDIFVRDLQTSTTIRVSVATNGLSGNGNSSTPLISTDGRYVLFRSRASNIATSPLTIGSENLFLRDLQNDTTYAITKSGVTAQTATPDVRFVAYIQPGPSAVVGVWHSQQHTNIYTTNTLASTIGISPDGSRIAYSLTSTGLRVADVITRSNWSIGSFTNSSRPGLRFSADGQLLAYATKETSTSTRSQVYLYNFANKSNLLISKRFDSAMSGSGSSDSPNISPDGRFIAYRSQAPDIIPGDAGGLPNLYLYDLLTGSTTLVSMNQNGNGPANNRSLNPSFSSDSQSLIFQSWASDLRSDDFNQSSDIFALKLTVIEIADTDHDGMDDGWETQHFTTLDRDGSGDFDSDGATDLFEFQTGTNPTNPNSIFRGEIVFDSLPSIRWTTSPGKAYQVQFKNNLDDPTWQDLSGSITIVGDKASVTDSSPTVNQRFYRITLVD